LLHPLNCARAGAALTATVMRKMMIIPRVFDLVAALKSSLAAWIEERCCWSVPHAGPKQ
jgi:hypothetical protein